MCFGGLNPDAAVAAPKGKETKPAAMALVPRQGVVTGLLQWTGWPCKRDMADIVDGMCPSSEGTATWLTSSSARRKHLRESRMTWCSTTQVQLVLLYRLWPYAFAWLVGRHTEGFSLKEVKAWTSHQHEGMRMIQDAPGCSFFLFLEAGQVLRGICAREAGGV